MPRRTSRARILFLNAVVALPFGIVALSTADAVLPFFVQQAGHYLLIVAVARLGLSIWDEAGEVPCHESVDRLRHQRSLSHPT